MIYLIFGPQSARNKVKMNRLAKESLGELDDLNFIKFDYNEELNAEIIDAIETPSLMASKRFIVISNATFLSKGNKNKFLDSLLASIKNAYDNDICFILEAEEVDKNNALYKYIEAYGKIFELLNINDDEWDAYIKAYFLKSLGANIDASAKAELKRRVHGDLTLFQNEAQKLALYSKNITLKDVELLVTNPLEEKTGDLFYSLLNNNKAKAIRTFRDLRVQNEEPVRIISMLGNQFRLLNDVRFLSKIGMNDDEIAKELKINISRVRTMQRMKSKIARLKIEETLLELYDLDLKIKSGLIDRFYGFESFLIRFKAY